MDALLTTFVTIAWLALLVATDTGQRRWLVVSGVASGLGLLTKSPALIVGPLMLAWLLANRWRGQAGRTGSRLAGTLSTGLVDLLWIGLPAALTMLLLWPALWVAPLATLQRLWQFSLALGGTGHELGNFWLGQPAEAPGVLFYPAVLLWRTTPATLIGLALALAFVLGRARRPDAGPAGAVLRLDRRRWLLALLLFSLWFGLIMSLGDKKFDRYLLPVFPIVSLLAAWGWMQGVERIQSSASRILHSAFRIPHSPFKSSLSTSRFWLTQRRKGAKLKLLPLAFLATWREICDLLSLALVAGVALVIIQAWFALANLPTFLTTYNPLLGGIRTAERVLLVGWGEGLEEAAAFLNQQPDARKSRAAAWYGQNVFGPFYQGQSYDLFYDLPSAADLYAHDVDYVVTYINQLQRELLDESVQAQLEQPMMSSSKGNVPLAQVYRWPKPFAHTGEQQLAPGLRLLGWAVESPEPVAGRLAVQLYWDASEALAASTELPPVSAWLKDEAGEVWASAEGRVVAPAGALAEGWLGRPVIGQSLELALPPGLLAGRYRVEAAPLDGMILALEEVDVAATTRTPGMDLAVQPLADEVLFGDSTWLLGYELAASGPDLALDLLWAADSSPPAGVNFFVHVVDGGDASMIVAQHDGVLAALPGRPASWQAGELARQRVRISLPGEVLARSVHSAGAAGGSAQTGQSTTRSVHSADAAGGSAQTGQSGKILAIVVGLYDAQSGQRLPLTVNGTPAADGRYLLATFQR